VLVGQALDRRAERARMSLWDAIRQTASAMWKHSSAALILVGGTVLYSFYYPVAYRAQVAANLPIAVVDKDHSGLSRDIARRLGAVRGVLVVASLDDVAEAQRRLDAREIDGYLVIPDRLESLALRNEAPVLELYSNGAYLIRNQTVLESMGAAVSTTIRGFIAKKLGAAGLAAPKLALSRNPLSVVDRPLFNPTEGYGSYVVPAVAQLIVQQTLLIGVAMLTAVRRFQGERVEGKALFGSWLFFVFVGILNGLYFNGFTFWLQDYPRAANVPGLLVAMTVFIAAVVSFGMFLGSFFTSQAKALQLIAVSSVPFFFLSGISWPTQAMPAAVKFIAAWIPSSSGIQAMVKINQMGASITDVRFELTLLATLALAYGVVAYLRLSRRGADAASGDG
jgi:ABC-2 type transport system permease protein